MESVINKIIEIDCMADSRLNDAQKQHNEILSKADAKSRSLISSINSAAEKRISEIEKINKSDYDSKVAMLEEKYKLEKNSMSNVFEQNHIKIEDMIFSEIVGE